MRTTPLLLSALFAVSTLDAFANEPEPNAERSAAHAEFVGARQRQMAFMMGWSLAVATVSRLQEDLPKGFADYQFIMAQQLGLRLSVQLAPLPALGDDKAQNERDATRYLREGTRPVATLLAQTIGDEAHVSFDLALQLAYLARLPTEQSKSYDEVLGLITTGAQRLGIVQAIMDPLLKKAKARPAAINTEVMRCADRISDFLTGAAMEAERLLGGKNR